MNSIIKGSAIVSLLCPLGWAQSNIEKVDPPAAVLSGEAVVAEEVAIVAAAHLAALWDNDGAADAQLSRPDALKAAASTVLARRAAAVCARLKNQRQIDKAKKLANRTAAQLDRHSAETARTDRVDRLYWEAWLRAEALDDKAAAKRLLWEAEKLAPADPRIAIGKKDWGG